MNTALGAAAGAAGLFAVTNVDDLVVLTALFLSSAASGRPRQRAIWLGQYLGLGALVAASAAAALGLGVVPDGYVRWLGLVPLALGLRGLWSAARSGCGSGAGSPPVVAGSLLGVAGVTVANGADNVAVYTPAFRAAGGAGVPVILAVFAAGVAVWCLAARWLGTHPAVVGAASRWGRWLVPAVFVALGLVILANIGVVETQ